MSQQMQRGFFDDTPDRRYPYLHLPPSDADINWWLDGPDCPLNQIIVSPSNRGPFDMLRTNAFSVLKRYNHCPRGCNFLVTGRSGGGKTYIMEKFAATLAIPYILVQSEGLDSTWTLFELLCKKFEEFGTPIVPDGAEDKYTIPPCIVAFDECHALPPKMRKGGLLCAMEYSDGILQTKKDKKSVALTVNCRNIGWAGMTTDMGLLFDAFKNRLSIPIEWASAGPNEICRILMLKLTEEFKKGDLPLQITDEAARVISRYELVPRLALSFGREVIKQLDMRKCTWVEAASIVAGNMRKMSSGFSEKQMLVLRALGQRPISKKTLTIVAQCRRMEELENDILPDLQDYSNGGPFVVSLSGRGCAVTKAGILKLNEMGIPHKGERVTAEYLEMRG